MWNRVSTKSLEVASEPFSAYLAVDEIKETLIPGP